MEPELNTRPRIAPILWRSKFLILASVILMVGVSAVYTVTAQKTYQATGIMQVQLETSNPGSSDTTTANQALAQNYATLLTSSGFLGRVRGLIDGGRHSTDFLQSSISATAAAQSALVEVHATGSSPEEAQRLGQQVISAFLTTLAADAASRTTKLNAQLQGEVTRITLQIDALRSSPGTTASREQISSLVLQRQALIAQNATILANDQAAGSSATESAAPVAPSAPISPRKSLNIIAGLLLGILLGVAAAWARENVRPAIHSADDVSTLVDLPLLASIPLKQRVRADDVAIPEAYGMLRANLAFMLRAGNLKVVTVAGFNPQVGKSSTVQGLAEAAARAEANVLMIDGDMRAASLTLRIGATDQPGLDGVLQGTVDLDDALVKVGERLWALPTGLARVNPGTLLSAGRTVPLLAELRRRFDLILIDSPPLARLADALILATHSDAVVLVARTGVTKPADLQSAVNSLQQVGAVLAGTVVFEEISDEPYYGQGYGYGYGADGRDASGLAVRGEVAEDEEFPEEPTPRRQRSRR